MGKVSRIDAYEDYGRPFAISDWKRFLWQSSTGIHITKSKKKDKI